MIILIACEYTQIVTEAFINKGHDVISCDLLDGEKGLSHYKGNIFDILDDSFDLMIAFPPCTYLSNVQSQWYSDKHDQCIVALRRYNQKIGIEFFMKLVNAPIDKICIENPLGVMSKKYRKHDQIIHPYYFGDQAKKRTCLWLKNLPLLEYDKDNLIIPEPLYYLKTNGKAIHHTESTSSKNRSRFWYGIAKAMAEQWG